MSRFVRVVPADQALDRQWECRVQLESDLRRCLETGIVPTSARGIADVESALDRLDRWYPLTKEDK